MHATLGNQTVIPLCRADRRRKAHARCATRFREGREQSNREGIAHYLVLRVPLYADDESRPRQAYRFDLPIGGHRLDAKSQGGTIDTLRMQRVDHNLASAGERSEKPARSECYGVSRPVRSLRRILA